MKRITPEKIETLEQNEVFVFGSNIQGEHVGGAAHVAFKSFGAKIGQGFGLMRGDGGMSYAIPTCLRVWRDGKRITKPLDSVEQIKPFVEAFIDDAKMCSDLTFFVTKIGCGIAGFKTNEIAELFRPCIDMENVYLPAEFYIWFGETEKAWNNLKH